MRIFPIGIEAVELIVKDVIEQVGFIGGGKQHFESLVFRPIKAFRRAGHGHGNAITWARDVRRFSRRKDKVVTGTSKG